MVEFLKANSSRGFSAEIDSREELSVGGKDGPKHYIFLRIRETMCGFFTKLVKNGNPLQSKLDNALSIIDTYSILGELVCLYQLLLDFFMRLGNVSY